jgi:hypothetical protein
MGSWLRTFVLRGRSADANALGGCALTGVLVEATVRAEIPGQHNGGIGLLKTAFVSDADHACHDLREVEYSSGKRHFSNSCPPTQLFFYEDYPIIEPRAPQ